MLYARFAIAYYWIVDPQARSIDVYQFVGTAYEGPQQFSGILSDLPPFPGLTLDLVSLWGPPSG
jgi:Uma2 family endonuclease